MRAFRYTVRPEFRHAVHFTLGALRVENSLLAGVFAREGTRPARVLAVIDRGAAQAQPGLVADVKNYFAAHARRVELAGAPLLVPGGEGAKNDWRLVEKIWSAVERQGLSRQSYVLVIGGGAVLDLVGFAAATAHRGIRLVRMPTTSLSQADGGVGVKNGVNFFGKKNWVGTFAVPSAVINDLDFLRTQTPVAARGGVVEAFKVGLIRDASLATLVERNAVRLARQESGVYERVIQESARVHLQHIAQGGDPFEQGTGRPLDFGHWLAHKLEQMSNFRLSHGDAVAAGVAVDARYSAACGWLPAAQARRVVKTLERLGCDTGNGKTNPLVRRLLRQRGKSGELTVMAGLEEFRQHLGGALTLTLLRRWGRGEETSAVDAVLMKTVVEKIAAGD
jgi:3-dehydroquinate synthase